MAFLDECPAIKELKAALHACFPSVDLQTVVNVYPGTRHTSGIAMDIMLDIREPREKAIGDGIIAAVINNYDAMKWSDLIYTDWKPDGSLFYFHIPGGGRGYGGTPLMKNPYGSDTEHTNHIHIDWVDFNLKNEGEEYKKNPYKWSDAALKTGFAGALRQDLQPLVTGQNLPGGGVAVPGWLWGWWTVTEDSDTYYYYFGLAGFVDWTDTKPGSNAAQMVNPKNRGIFTVSTQDEVVITWNWLAEGQTVETFKPAPGHKRRMTGTSNRWGDLAATKR